MHQEIEELARRSAGISARVRCADEQLLRFIRESVEEECSAAREYRRQIRRRLYHLRVVSRIHLDNTLVSNLHNNFPKLREIRNNLIDLDRSLGLDRLGNLLRICSNTILFRELRGHPLELW